MTVKRRPAPGEPLTERELEILRGMALGMTNPQIGKLLFLTEDTIKTHARRVFDKLGTRNRVLAVLRGLSTGCCGVLARSGIRRWRTRSRVSLSMAAFAGRWRHDWVAAAGHAVD